MSVTDVTTHVHCGFITHTHFKHDKIYILHTSHLQKSSPNPHVLKIILSMNWIYSHI